MSRPGRAVNTFRSPSIDDLAGALDTLLDALEEHRAGRPKGWPLPPAGMALLEVISAEALQAASDEDLEAWDLTHDPIEYALKTTMKTIARLIAAKVKTIDELQTRVRRFADTELRYAILDKAFDGARTADNGIWLA
jgi:hypothetical protein